ncbi:ATP-binding protein [Streptomyces actuosus]|nr:ATP-binding protein [Streptomyces actuosus]
MYCSQSLSPRGQTSAACATVAGGVGAGTDALPGSVGDDRPADYMSPCLAHRPESVGLARRLARSVLRDWRIDESAAASVLLVVSELVTNAVQYARPPLYLRLCRETAGLQVLVGITDGGRAVRTGDWAASCAAEEHGRGMSIIDALATCYGSRSHGLGLTTHWARLAVPNAVPAPGPSDGV